MTAKSLINSRKSYSCECLLSDRKDRYRSNNNRTMKQEAGQIPTQGPPSVGGHTPNRHLNLSLDIPQDGNISLFTPDQMATFLRLMNIDEHIVQRLHKKELDGKKFSKLKDSVLEDIGMKNPVICYFRDKSKSSKNQSSFWL